MQGSHLKIETKDNHNSTDQLNSVNRHNSVDLTLPAYSCCTFENKIEVGNAEQIDTYYNEAEDNSDNDSNLEWPDTNSSVDSYIFYPKISDRDFDEKSSSSYR